MSSNGAQYWVPGSPIKADSPMKPNEFDYRGISRVATPLSTDWTLLLPSGPLLGHWGNGWRRYGSSPEELVPYGRVWDYWRQQTRLSSALKEEVETQRGAE